MKHILPDGLLSEATATLRRLFGNGGAPAQSGPSHARAGNAARPSLPEALRSLLDQIGHGTAPAPTGEAAASQTGGAKFLARSFSNQAGTRPYKLYVPSGYHGQPVPLVVMLHGCTQSPDDFAAGTQMNAAAERETCLVAYPGQTRSANLQKCWNWFNEADQGRDAGEPSIIAGITREVMRDYAVDPRRVYVAGLSAGGAAAAVMGDAYPDLYAAVAVHSGLACGAAHDIPSALAAMQRGSNGTTRQTGKRQRRVVPAIVFHGDRDTTVNPRNADAVVAQVAQAAALRVRSEQGQAAGGHPYTRTLYTGADGQAVIEQWQVHGAGHAWLGGSAAGSYADPRGPDATREALRFFLEHPRPLNG